MVWQAAHQNLQMAVWHSIMVVAASIIIIIIGCILVINRGNGRRDINQ